MLENIGNQIIKKKKKRIKKLSFNNRGGIEIFDIYIYRLIYFGNLGVNINNKCLISEDVFNGGWWGN